MSRTNRMTSGSSNPATKFLQWKSMHQKFAYYDKVEQQNVFVDLPFRFLAIARYKTVKGWNQKKEGAIIANEVKSLKDNLKVQFYPKNSKDRQTIADGPWSEIKETVDGWDGKYTESVYIMLPDGELANLQLNGASLSTWFEFQNNQSDKFFDTWVTVNAYKEGKNGAVTYTFPVFEWGKELTKADESRAEKADEKIQAYEQSYFTTEPRQHSEVNKYKERVNAENDMHRDLQPVQMPPEEDKKMLDYDPDDLPF